MKPIEHVLLHPISVYAFSLDVLMQTLWYKVIFIL